MNGHVIYDSNISMNNGSILSPAYQFLKSRGGGRRSSCPTLVGKDGKSLFAQENPIKKPVKIVSAQNKLNADSLTCSVKSALRRNCTFQPISKISNQMGVSTHNLHSFSSSRILDTNS